MENKSEYNDGLNQGRKESAAEIERLHVDIEKLKYMDSREILDGKSSEVLDGKDFKYPWCCPDA